ncbi:hypothetical protein [Haloarcula sediminis]|uniref:hypothetical protein n=1 Tax=Haloarcula sediminis TaxID=3111777 RepID=UPI002D776217|nr:hypothetical protein [Haloarcula sp. CK38]
MLGKIDFVDALMGALFTLASASQTGIYAGARLQPGNFALGDPIYTAGGTAITLAFVFSITTIAVAYGTNRLDDGKKGPDMSVNTDIGDIVKGAASYETYIAGATLALVILSGFNVLGFNGFVNSHWVYGYIVTGTQMGGYYVFSWMG